MKIFVTGGSGLVGRGLIGCYRDEDDQIVVLTRNLELAHRHLPHLNDRVRLVEGDLLKPGRWETELQGSDVVINLAGSPVVCRWSQRNRNSIYESRVNGTRNLVRALSHLTQKPKVLISASAVGFYGYFSNNDAALVESSAVGEGFLATLCSDWENAALEAEKLGVRTSVIRIGVVLHPSGGILDRLSPIFKMGLGGRIGSGEQWVPWIHRTDLVNIIADISRSSTARGIFNGTSPAPVKNHTFAETLADAYGRPCRFNVPSAALKLIYGEAAQLMLSGQRVIPQRVVAELGYEFKFPTLQSAMNDLIRLN